VMLTQQLSVTDCITQKSKIIRSNIETRRSAGTEFCRMIEIRRDADHGIGYPSISVKIAAACSSNNAMSLSVRWLLAGSNSGSKPKGQQATNTNQQLQATSGPLGP